MDARFRDLSEINSEMLSQQLYTAVRTWWPGHVAALGHSSSGVFIFVMLWGIFGYVSCWHCPSPLCPSGCLFSWLRRTVISWWCQLPSRGGWSSPVRWGIFSSLCVHGGHTGWKKVLQLLEDLREMQHTWGRVESAPPAFLQGWETSSMVGNRPACAPDLHRCCAGTP